MRLRGALPLRFGQRLTEVELELIQSVSRGVSYEVAAALRGVSVQTVKEQAVVVRRKLGACNNAHAVALAITQGLI